MVVKFPFGICQKTVGMKHNAICCDLCNTWIHIACNNLDKKNIKQSYKNQPQTGIVWPVLKNKLLFLFKQTMN